MKTDFKVFRHFSERLCCRPLDVISDKLFVVMLHDLTLLVLRELFREFFFMKMHISNSSDKGQVQVQT